MECPDYLLIHVADSGPGIPADERERVFERFRQVKSNQPVRGAKGVGLGLTFTRLALEAHGGRIWVEQNSPLSGACFAVTLPYKPSVQ
jgi:signal transduction histidine kinase